MRRQEQIAEAKKLLAHLERRTTAMAETIYENPVTDYTCPQQAARERELFFREGPINIGLGCLLPRPGDWLTHDYSGVPIGMPAIGTTSSCARSGSVDLTTSTSCIAEI